MANDISRFIDAIGKSLTAGTFVKLTLGNYKGADETLQKIIVRRIVTKKGDRLDLTYRYKTRDVAKNYPLDEALDILQKMIGSEFRSGNLFTTEKDIQIEIRKRTDTRLSTAKPTFSATSTGEHDRAKKRQIDPHEPYLHELGITSSKGEILGKQRDKWTQINKFVEIVGSLIDGSKLKDAKAISIVDMGSGKGYLTFALYDFLNNARGIDASITGVEVRKELVDLCNKVSKKVGFDGLNFVQNTIEGFAMPKVDVLIALHACNTATDDAIYKGIKSDAQLIIAAPCCHQELRPQIKPPDIFKDILKHGIMMERVAENITDGLRSMLLERSGYTSKLFEFVPSEHTPKNNMLVGTRAANSSDREALSERIRQIKEFYGIREQRLEKLLTKEPSIR